jgi:hypothetical protein
LMLKDKDSSALWQRLLKRMTTRRDKIASRISLD